jgi:hypothetical protein
VSESTRIIILMILVLVLLLVLAIYGQTVMMKRALKQVLKTLRMHEALSAEKAKFVNEMGLQKKGILQLKAFRDYKPTAIQFLIKQEIIVVTEEGKIYLSEEALLNSGIEARINGQKTVGTY